MKQPVFWAKFKAFAKKSVPSRPLRWCLIYVPAFTAALLFALRVFGEPIAGSGNSFDDFEAYILEIGVRSLPVLIVIAITYGLASGLGWNLDNEERAYYQRVLTCTTRPGELEGSQWGAFAVLAGEMLSILALLVSIHRALLVLQG